MREGWIGVKGVCMGGRILWGGGDLRSVSVKKMEKFDLAWGKNTPICFM